MLPGCETNDKTILSGDIIGMVYLIDEYDHYLSDRSGINVNLIFDDIPVMYTTTDQIGRFYFENIPYGTYRIDLGKEGFVKSLSSHTVYHVGGYSPTQMKYNLYEVPTFELVIDSIEFKGSNESSAIYLQLIGVTEMPESGYFTIRCFCSDTPDVSKNNFVTVDPGWIWMYPEYIIDQAAIANAILGFYQVESDSMYLRIYPQARGQGYDDYSEESLGKPSNVIRFRIK